VPVDHPLDPFYPFQRELYEDEHVVYHGTWSTYAPLIEAHGMGREYLAYNQEDIDALCKMGWRLGCTGDAMNGGVDVLQACAYGFKKGKRPIYLTLNYWCARGYARNRGGETVQHALVAIDDLEQLLADRERRRSHAARLRERLRDLTGEDREVVLEQLDSIRDTRLLAEMSQQLAGIAGRIRSLAAHGHPVVYAIKADPRWYQWQYDSHPIGTFEVARVPARRIRARADFVNGVEQLDEDALMPRPLRWDLKPYLQYVKRHVWDGSLGDHLQFLKETTDALIRTAVLEEFG
jgi:hypothetical protein